MKIFGGFNQFAKFGTWNWCNCFDDMQVFVFCTLGLSMPIVAPKIGIWGI